MIFRIDPKSDIPIYQQIVNQVKFAILTGTLKPGGLLPSVRRLSTDLVVNPNTVARAFREMESAGLTESRKGSGTFVRKDQDFPRPELRERTARAILRRALEEAKTIGVTAEQAMRLVADEIERLYGEK